MTRKARQKRKERVKAMAEKRLFHAYMLTGAEGPGRDAAARNLAARLLCTAEEPPCGLCRDCRKVLAGIHPDVITVRRQEGPKGPHREILVDQIRDMTADAALAPNEASRKVYIIDPADRMRVQAQDALLKALEDPPGHACFILCTAAADALLPTVRSRCVRETVEERMAGPDSAGEELAGEYLSAAASGDPCRVAQVCLRLPADQAEAFAEGVKNAVWEMLRGRRKDLGLDRETLYHLTALMDRTEDYLRHNVLPIQIFGMLAAETLRVREI